MTPSQISPILVPGIDAYRVYQISRNEDGRQRYRLRIGFFDNQSEARELLTKLRELYPAAFVTSLCNEDQKFLRGYTTAAKPAVEAVPVKVAAPTAPSRPATPAPTPPAVTARTPTPPPAKPAKPATPAATASRGPAAASAKPAKPAKPAATPAKPVPAAAPPAATATATPRPTPAAAKPPTSPPVLTLDVEWEATPAPAKTTPAAAKAEPFHVGRGVAVPPVEFELLTDDTPADLGHQPSVEAEDTELTTVPVDSDLEPWKAMRAQASTLPREPKQLDANAPLPPFDSTITIRALTTTELEDETQAQWFVVQLAASEQPVNLDTMPRLDIFTAYRLYSVAVPQAGAVTHSLRLGFFTEAVSAEAVCGYLKTFFGAPKVVRISAAEQSRFEKQPQPKMFSAPSSTGQVIELATPKPVTPVQLSKPAGSGTNQGVDRRQAPRHDAEMAALEMKLMEEARLTETGIQRLAKNTLLSRLVGKLTK